MFFGDYFSQTDVFRPFKCRGVMKGFFMRLTVLLTFLLFIAQGIIAQDNAKAANGKTTAKPAATPAKPSTPAKKGIFSILLGRPVDAAGSSESHWCSALIEAVLEFKLAAIPDIDMVSHDTIARHFPAHNNFKVTPEDADYMEQGKKLKVDYVGIQKFEVTRKKEVFYYLEISSPKNRTVVATIERTFKLKVLGVELDEIIGMILREFKVTPPRDQARFLKLPAIDEDVRAFRQLGELIVRERFARNTDSIQLAADYRSICERERKLHVAYYRAGFLFAAVGKYNDAAEAFNILFLSMPEYRPVYIPLSRCFRKSNRQQDAIRIAMLGEKRGITDSELTAEKALAYLDLGKQKEAEDAYKKVLASNPNDPYGLLFYAKLSNDNKNPSEALKYTSRLLKDGNHVGNAYLEQGRSYVLLKKTEDAIASLSKAVNLLPGEIEPVIYLGDAKSVAGKYKEALALYERALSKVDNNIDLYIKAALAAEKIGDQKKALVLLKKIESRFSNHGILQRELGVLTLANGDTAKAKMHLEAAMRGDAEDERVLMGLGWIYIHYGNLDKARTMFNRAMKVVKNKAQVKVGLAMVHIKKGETQKAAALIREVSAANISIPGFNGMLGDAMKAKGEKKNALVYYRKESKFSPSDRGLQVKIADLSYDLEPASTARSEYKKLLEMGGAGSVALYRLGILSLKLKDAKSAEEYIGRAKKAGDADASTWLAIGKGYAVLGKRSQALDAYQQSARKDASKEEVWKAIVDLQTKSGNDTGAASAHMKLYRLNPKKYGKNLATAGILYEKAGDIKKAKSAYATFIKNKHVDANVNIRFAKLVYKEKNYTSVLSLLKPLTTLQLGVENGMLLAEAYFVKKMYKEAIPLLEFIVTKSPKNTQALEWAALANEYTKQYKVAIKMYRKYLRYAEKNKNYAFHLAELIEGSGDKAGAITQYRANIKAYPDDPRNYDRLANIYMEEKNWRRAVTMLEKALTFEKASPRLMGLLARANMALGKKNTAMKYLQDYIKNAPNDSSAWYELGMLYYDGKNYKEAAKTLQRAAGLMKKPGAEIYKHIGISHLSLKDTAAATGFLEKAHDSDKADKEVAEMLAECYRAAGNTRQLAGILFQRLKDEPENDKIRIELAEVYLAESKYSDATKLLERALEKKECDVPLRLKLAAVYEKQNNTKRWLVHLQTASRCDPKNVEMLFEIGRYYYEQKNRLQAERYLKRALRIDKRYHPANYMLGSILLTRKAYKAAGVFLSRAVAVERKNEEYRIALTEAFYQQGRYEDAYKVIGPLVRKGDIKPSALRWAGLIYKAMGNPDTAKQILENAIQVEKDCSECYIALGDLYFDEADYRNAASRYQSAFDTKDFSSDAAIKLAHCYMKMGREGQAEHIYEKVLEESPQDGEALYRIVHINLKKGLVGAAKSTLSKNKYNKNGWYYLADGEISEAENNINGALLSFGKALKLIPEVPEVQAGCGRISLKKRKYAAAIKYFGRAMAGDPENLDIMLGMGQAYEGRGDRMTALDLYQEVARQQPDNADVHYYMARVYSRSKEHEMAIKSLQEGIRRNRKNAKLYLALGHEYRLTKNTSGAIEYYLKAAKLDEIECLEAYRHIGNIYYRNRNEKKAKKYYGIYIKLGGKNKKVRRYMNRIR